MDQNQIEDRLARLETENRRLKRAGLGALIGLGSLTLMSFAAPTLCEIVWAERFVLRDGSNKTRVTMNAYGTDTPGLTFHDARGKAVGSFGFAPDGGFRIEQIKNGRRSPAMLQMTGEGSYHFAAPAPKSEAKPARDITGDHGVG